MGVTSKTYNRLINTFQKIEHPINELVLLELGIQESVEPLGFRYLRDDLKDKFNRYVSLDLHDIEGVTKFDLSILNDNAFEVDIITNFGTTEHVEYEDGQYNCWSNLHHWLKVGGIAIHEIPEYGSWKNHCRYYTTFDFFKNMENYGYRILELDNHHGHNGNLNWVVIKKITDVPFMSYDVFYNFMMVDKNVVMDIIDPLNNPKHLQ